MCWSIILKRCATKGGGSLYTLYLYFVPLGIHLDQSAVFPQWYFHPAGSIYQHRGHAGEYLQHLLLEEQEKQQYKTLTDGNGAEKYSGVGVT